MYAVGILRYCGKQNSILGILWNIDAEVLAASKLNCSVSHIV
jgi:hypothetical protein